MQALLPPPPIQCVEPKQIANSDVKLFVTVAGEPEQVAKWLSELSKQARWTAEADASNNNIRFVRLTLPRETPYRVIGGAVFNGQRRKLDIGVRFDPPICEPEEK